MAQAGKLIVLEGLDDTLLGALSERIGHWLRDRGIAAQPTREPTNGPAGVQVRLAQQGRLQLDPASLALLWVADRLDHLECRDGIHSWLVTGHHVLCVHYALFAYAHQWGQVEWEWLRRIDAPCRVPDLTLFVDMSGPPADEACAGEAERLRAGYLDAIERLRGEGQPVVVVEGRDMPDEAFEVCVRHVLDLLKVPGACANEAAVPGTSGGRGSP